MTENGNPFFWLGDTGWLLFSKLERNEALQYLDDRKDKGFNVIQVMVLHELGVSNAYGDAAIIDDDVSRPMVTPGNDFDNPNEYDYWDHMDFIIGEAKKRGIYMALVPVWGSNVRSGKISFEQAVYYSEWLAKRYANQSNIIWLNGGDTKGNENIEIWDAIGSQLDKYAPNHLITFHPYGRTQSSWWFHNAEWLDFNMFQSGHRRYDQDDTELSYGEDNWKYVEHDYALDPKKPTLDGEPSYEGIPQGLHDPEEPYWDDDDVRRYAYWSVFAGGCGFTYGHSAIMQMHKPGDFNPSYGVREYWMDAINSPGASQLIHLKNLLLSKSYFSRVPDPSLVSSDQGKQYDYLAATRGENYALIYTYTGRNISLSMGKINGENVLAKWYNPRNGRFIAIGEFENEGIKTFDPPGKKEEGKDWVLVIEALK